KRFLNVAGGSAGCNKIRRIPKRPWTRGRTRAWPSATDGFTTEDGRADPQPATVVHREHLLEGSSEGQASSGRPESALPRLNSTLTTPPSQSGGRRFGPPRGIPPSSRTSHGRSASVWAPAWLRWAPLSGGAAPRHAAAPPIEGGWHMTLSSPPRVLGAA